MMLNEKEKEYVSSFLALVIVPRELRNWARYIFEEEEFINQISLKFLHYVYKFFFFLIVVYSKR